MHLLLIEDDPTMQTTLQRTLRRRGMEVTPITDGGAALPAWRKLAPDVVVLDLSCRRWTGWRSLPRRAAKAWPPPP